MKLDKPSYSISCIYEQEIFYSFLLNACLELLSLTPKGNVKVFLNDKSVKKSVSLSVKNEDESFNNLPSNPFGFCSNH